MQATEHPRQKLIFFMLPDFTRQHVEEMLLLVDRLERRVWSLGPPLFFDEVDEESATQPGDRPIWSVGVFLEIYSAVSPLHNLLPKELSKTQYEEVVFLSNEIAQFSALNKVDFTIQLDSEDVGVIISGKWSQEYQLGMLEEWAKTLG